MDDTSAMVNAKFILALIHNRIVELQSERDRAQQRARAHETERDRQCVCVCV